MHLLRIYLFSAILLAIMANIAGYILASVIILALSPLGIVLTGSIGLSLVNSIPLILILITILGFTFPVIGALA